MVSVSFLPGAWTDWHRHERGQILIVTSGGASARTRWGGSGAAGGRGRRVVRCRRGALARGGAWGLYLVHTAISLGPNRVARAGVRRGLPRGDRVGTAGPDSGGTLAAPCSTEEASGPWLCRRDGHVAGIGDGLRRPLLRRHHRSEHRGARACPGWRPHRGQHGAGLLGPDDHARDQGRPRGHAARGRPGRRGGRRDRHPHPRHHGHVDGDLGPATTESSRAASMAIPTAPRSAPAAVARTSRQSSRASARTPSAAPSAAPRPRPSPSPTGTPWSSTTGAPSA